MTCFDHTIAYPWIWSKMIKIKSLHKSLAPDWLCGRRGRRQLRLLPSQQPTLHILTCNSYFLIFNCGTIRWEDKDPFCPKNSSSISLIQLNRYEVMSSNPILAKALIIYYSVFDKLIRSTNSETAMLSRLLGPVHIDFEEQMWSWRITQFLKLYLVARSPNQIISLILIIGFL